QFGGDLGAPNVLPLQAVRAQPDPERPLTGTATLTESPPVVHARTTLPRDSYARLQRTLVNRHTSNDRIVAMIEVPSAGNKSGRRAIVGCVESSTTRRARANAWCVVENPIHPRQVCYPVANSFRRGTDARSRLRTAAPPP